MSAMPEYDDEPESTTTPTEPVSPPAPPSPVKAQASPPSPSVPLSSEDRARLQARADELGAQLANPDGRLNGRRREEALNEQTSIYKALHPEAPEAEGEAAESVPHSVEVTFRALSIMDVAVTDEEKGLITSVHEAFPEHAERLPSAISMLRRFDGEPVPVNPLEACRREWGKDFDKTFAALSEFSERLPEPVWNYLVTHKIPLRPGFGSYIARVMGGG